MAKIESLMKEIESFSKTYQFTFQFWGVGNNNCFIMKDHVDLYDCGGYLTPEDVMISALHYIYKINRTKKRIRVC